MSIQQRQHGLGFPVCLWCDGQGCVVMWVECHSNSSHSCPCWQLYTQNGAATRSTRSEARQEGGNIIFFRHPSLESMESSSFVAGTKMFQQLVSWQNPRTDLTLVMNRIQTLLRVRMHTDTWHMDPSLRTSKEIWNLTANKSTMHVWRDAPKLSTPLIRRSLPGTTCQQTHSALWWQERWLTQLAIYGSEKPALLPSTLFRNRQLTHTCQQPSWGGAGLGCRPGLQALAQARDY